MAIDIDDLHRRANEIYAERKLGPDYVYRAPECRPTIQSDQVKALMEALQEQLTAAFAKVREEIADVYRHLDGR